MHSGEAPIVEQPYIPMLPLFYLLSNILQSAFYHCTFALVSRLLGSKMLRMVENISWFKMNIKWLQVEAELEVQTC